VDWHNCINEDPALNFEVANTHGGMAFNPAVYRLLALRLADAGRTGQPDPVPPKQQAKPGFDFARWRK
jgi:hypothetical protein